MVKMGDEVIDFIKGRPAFIATSTPDGIPNVVHKGSLQLLDDEHLIYADIFSGKTTENIRNNPNVAISIIDFKNFRGYQLKGKAFLLDSGEIYEKIVKFVENLPMKLPKPKYAVKIHVEEIYDLTPGPNAGKKIS